MPIKSPKISLLAPTYNHEQFVGFFIESVLTQIEQDFELIIVDDYSQDNTIKEVEKFNDKRIKLIKHPYNQGINSGLNTAFKVAQGEFCVFIGTDDFLDKKHLKFTSKLLEKNPELAVLYCGMQEIDEHNQPTRQKYIRKNRSKYKILYDSFMLHNVLFSPGMVIRKKALETIMPLNQALFQFQDYSIHVELLLNFNCYLIEDILVSYRYRQDGQNACARNSATVTREQLEQTFLMDKFLKIKDLELLKSVFGEQLKKFGEPTIETIPYFLGRLALTSNDYSKKAWGYQTILKFIQDGKLDLLNKLYGLQFKDVLRLAESFDQPIKDN
ncbi:glycosyltransferase family 2 protein [Desulfovibrio litoralis]|uniref:Glycosyltransferase involved in cell wall bisynthesis n=1 Tax=Desulfovibrio litoralis DSM 11393 TaxID=1121455 RepID=A0A1M7S6U9_9BACT|nr:glycosyltransferase family 2 protein [Desulfovibrio litoralis]SHN54170.1 Glycosyltransferase involved in cell wall bisynthesis [Desulfovibrio litoralis DSM 11393]